MTVETSQTPPAASPPKPGQPGYKPSRETLEKMQKGRRAKEDAKKKDRQSREAARAGAPGRAPAAPSTSAALPEKTRRRIAEKIIAPSITFLSAAGFWTARHLTAPAVPLGEPQADGKRYPDVTELEYVAMVQAWRSGEARAFREDELEKWEVDYVADELTTELVKWPRVRALLLQLLAIADRGGLATAVLVIAAPRMIRHGMIPDEFRELAAEMVEGMRAEAKKRRHVVEEEQAAHVGDNGSSAAGASPHYTEPQPVT